MKDPVTNFGKRSLFIFKLKKCTDGTLNCSHTVDRYVYLGVCTASPHYSMCTLVCALHIHTTVCVPWCVHSTSTLQYVYLGVCTTHPHYSMFTLVCALHIHTTVCVPWCMHSTSTLQYVYLGVCTTHPHYSMCTLVCALHIHTTVCVP
jgi:hypothetical protein